MDRDQKIRLVKSEPAIYTAGRICIAFFALLKKPTVLFLSFEGRDTVDTWKRVIARLVLLPLLLTAVLVSCEFTGFRKDPYIKNPDMNFANFDARKGEYISYTAPNAPKK